MSAFLKLTEVTKKFEDELRQVAAEIFTAKVGENFEDILSKKLRDFALFTSKLRLLRAVPLSSTSQVRGLEKSEDTLNKYGNIAEAQVLEQTVTTSLSQMHAVKTLISTPQRKLDPGLIEKQEKIIDSIRQYRLQDTDLRHLYSILTEKEAELASLRAEWDEKIGQLRDMRDYDSDEETETSGPLNLKLQKLLEKLDILRWLIEQLATARCSGYDWIADPDNRFKALALERSDASLRN